MLPGLDQLACQDISVPMDVMEHVVRVESSFNPFAIGVVGGRLVRQPRNLPEALATVRMLEEQGYNFSLGLSQVNRHNLAKYGLTSYEAAFDSCQNLKVGARILAECHKQVGGDWGRAFSCYYSGDTVTGFRHGYVQKVFASMRDAKHGDQQIEPLGLVATSPEPLAVSRHPRRTASATPGPGIPSAEEGTPAPAQPVALPSGSVAAAQATDRDHGARDQAFVF